MKIAIIGSGGREHALGYKLAESKSVEKLFFIPGNAGTINLGINIKVSIDDFNSILSHVNENEIDLVVIGPEQPLVNGLADFLESNNIKVFGPGKSAAKIEGEKSFAKSFMKEHNIPTADFNIFTSENKAECLSYLKKTSYPIVIKADGLAAGKGVVICESYVTAEETVIDFFENSKFGDAGKKIVVEEFLRGNEISIFAITDGTNYFLLPPSQDHKRIFDEDKGPNTGGMGAYAPVPFADKLLLDNIEKRIVIPTLKGMEKKGSKFSGVLYFGLMITDAGPKVIEYNCRFGDPETQAVLPLLKGDFAKMLYSVAEGKLDVSSISLSDNLFSVSVVAASEGYPLKYEKGKKIFGLDKITGDNVFVFHAGTKLNNEDQVITNGGRVLAVTALGDSLENAKSIAYQSLQKIYFDGIYYREDISDKGLLTN